MNRRVGIVEVAEERHVTGLHPTGGEHTLIDILPADGCTAYLHTVAEGRVVLLAAPVVAKGDVEREAAPHHHRAEVAAIQSLRRSEIHFVGSAPGARQVAAAIIEHFLTRTRVDTRGANGIDGIQRTALIEEVAHVNILGEILLVLILDGIGELDDLVRVVNHLSTHHPVELLLTVTDDIRIERSLKTLVAHLAHVGGVGRETGAQRKIHRREQVARGLVVIVELRHDTVVEHADLRADIHLLGLLPGEGSVAEPHHRRRGPSEVTVAVGILISGIGILRREVLGTCDTVGSLEAEVTEDMLILHEMLTMDIPAYTCAPERRETLVAAKL